MVRKNTHVFYTYGMCVYLRMHLYNCLSPWINKIVYMWTHVVLHLISDYSRWYNDKLNSHKSYSKLMYSVDVAVLTFVLIIHPTVSFGVQWWVSSAVCRKCSTMKVDAFTDDAATSSPKIVNRISETVPIQQLFDISNNLR